MILPGSTFRKQFDTDSVRSRFRNQTLTNESERRTISHVATISIEIKDKDALIAAMEELGFEWVPGQKHYRWWGRHVGDYPLPEGYKVADMGRCDTGVFRAGEAALKRFGKTSQQMYEVGVNTARNGKPGFDMLWDFIDCDLCDMMGDKHASKFKQTYAAIVATKKLKAAGMTVTRKVQADGSIKLIGMGR